MTDRDKALELLEQAAATCASEQPQGQKLTYEVLRGKPSAHINLQLERDGQTFNSTLWINPDLTMMQSDPLQNTLRVIRNAVRKLQDGVAEAGSSPEPEPEKT